ncbi:hemolysin, partial [Sinorhizobium meliloti]
MTKIVGTGGGDTLRGTDETDRIWGLAGNDDIDGGGGDDLVDAGAGDDVVRSTSGYDRLDGGDGDDRLTLAGTGGAVTGGAGHDTLAVNASLATEDVIFNGLQGHAMIGRNPSTAQHVFFRDIERLELLTGSGNDIVYGSTRDDVIVTGDGS